MVLVMRLWHYLTGYLHVTAQGEHLEEFMNATMSRGLFLWNIRRTEGGIHFCISISGFKNLRSIARETHSRVRIAKKCGFPFQLVRIRRRPVFIAGLVVCIAIVYILSSMVWFIEVKGLKEIPEREVLEVAREFGLAVGSFKFKVDPDLVEEQLVLKIRGLAWVGINIEGIKATIDVVEKRLLEDEQHGPIAGHLVAGKDGVITKVLVIEGQPMVDEGDTVRRGDILIAGYGAADSLDSVRARGIIEAKVWYSAYGKGSLVSEVNRRTGRSVRVDMLCIGPFKIALRGGKRLPFANYDRQVITRNLMLRDVRLPVQHLIITYSELVTFREQKSKNEAYNVAVSRATAQLDSQIPPDAEVLSRDISIIEENDQEVIVRVVVEAVENIGELRPIITS